MGVIRDRWWAWERQQLLVTLSPIVASQSLVSNNPVVFDLRTGEVQVVTLSANVTASTIINPSTINAGQQLRISWAQDATGGRIYIWPVECRFAGGSAPTDSTARTRTTVTFVYDGMATGIWHEVGRSIAVPV